MNPSLINQIQTVKTIAISGHVRPDGDCVGSCMALFNYIYENYGITADVYLETIPESYKLDSTCDVVLSDYNQDKTYDLFVALDCGDRQRLGNSAVYFDNARKTICVDHHISNLSFADENIIMPKASSTCEVLWGLLEEDKISLKTANYLYMGIICDTGCFKHNNTSEATMSIAGRLITKGVDNSKIMDDVFFRKTYIQNRLLGACLLQSQRYLKNQCIICVVTKDLLKEYNASSSDLEGVIDQLRVTDGVEVAVVMTETNDGAWKLSMRSCTYANVSSICVSMGGGGHIRASGATVTGTKEEVIQLVLSKLKEQIYNHD